MVLKRPLSQARKGKLPSLDDDPRWVPLIMAHHLRSERLTGHRLDTRATADLMKDLKSGKLLCMRRNDETGECERVPRTFWNDHEIDVRLGFVQIYRGPRGPYGYDPRNCIEGWLLYVLGPAETKQPHEDRGAGYKQKKLISYIKENYPGCSWAKILEKAGGVDGLRTKVKEVHGLEISRAAVFIVRKKLFGSKNPKV